jgi:hypothetical protein
MITFKQYLEEGRFRDSKKLVHVMDVPMFSIFIEKSAVNRFNNPMVKKFVKDVFDIARTEIQHMGFPSMHVNVLFKHTPDAYGLAHGNPEKKGNKVKSISLSYRFLEYLNGETNRDPKYTSTQLWKTIVHEWAHIWMFNNGQAFRKAVADYHEALTHSNIDKIPYNYVDPTRAFNFFYQFLIMKAFRNPDPHKLYTIVYEKLLDTLQELGMYAMAVDTDIIKRYSNNVSKLILQHSNEKHHIGLIEAIKNLNGPKLFGNIVKQETQSSLMRNSQVRKQLSDLVNFTGAYGMSNPDETWATALEKFNTLHPYHRKRIFELMQVKEPRDVPNSRMKKHKKAKQQEYLKNVTLDDL